MAVAIQRRVRRALLAKLKAHDGLTALVPAASIGGDGEPSWPHILLRAPVTRRLRAAGVNGGEGSYDIHAFARAREVAGTAVETGEDHAGRIGGEIESALADTWLTLEDGYKCRIELGDMRLLQDDAPDDWHYFAQINWRVIAA